MKILEKDIDILLAGLVQEEQSLLLLTGRLIEEGFYSPTKNINLDSKNIFFIRE